MSENDRTPQEAMGAYNRAQADEAEARARGGDPVAIMEAKRRQAAAMDEIYRLQNAARTHEGEDTVTLGSPNPWANVTDSRGVTFVDGKAEGVPRSLAERYLLDFEGYKLG